MKRIQILRLISIGSAFWVGFSLPIRMVDLDIPVYVDMLFNLSVSCLAAVNIYLHFYEYEKDFFNKRDWLSVGLFFDVLYLIPFACLDYFVFPGEYKYFLLLNLFATRHIWRIKAFLDEFDNLQPVVYRLIPMLLMMPLLVHLVACGWIALGSGTAGADPDKIVEYIRAVYWSFTTLTTVGYGDISAKTPLQMLFASGVQVTGVGVFGFILSNVASLLTRLDAAREHHMDSLDRIETFMRSHQIPPHLRNSVRSYFHYIWMKHKGYSDRTLLGDLPSKIQSELLFFINKTIIEKVPLLKGASHELLEDLMSCLLPKIFVPGERIFHVGEPGEAMYFIHSGAVEILGADHGVIATLNEGAFFGEMALISDRLRSATARAVTYCDVYALPKASFERAVATYPEFKQNIEQVAADRAGAKQPQ